MTEGRFQSRSTGPELNGCSQTCTLCDTRLAVVAVHRLDDVALHVTRTQPWGEDARCVECCLDDLTRLVVTS